MKRTSKKVYNQWSIRDEKGRFVKHDYTGRTYTPDGKGGLAKGTIGVPVRVRKQYEENQKKKSEQRTVRGAQLPLQKVTIPEDYSETTEERILGSIDETFNLSELAQSTADTAQSNIVRYGRKIVAGDFEFNYKLQKKYGEAFNREQQKKYYDLMVFANAEGDKIAEYTGGLLHPRFSIKIPDDLETAELRIKTAQEVISGEYINSTYAQYYADFIDNYKYHLEPEDFKRLKEAIKGLSPYELFKMMADNAWASRPYSLESEITEYAYAWVMDETEAIIDKANKLKASKLAEETIKKNNST